jgi:high-affinity K+ transport system ATPase subunit B
MLIDELPGHALLDHTTGVLKKTAILADNLLLSVTGQPHKSLRYINDRMILLVDVAQCKCT